MNVSVMQEEGYHESLLGIGLSYGLTSLIKDVDELLVNSSVLLKLEGIANSLVNRGGSHAKFLESIAVWLDINAPRYWWQQFDTYRIGVTKQSESTMHTIARRPLDESDFATHIPDDHMAYLNAAIEEADWPTVKAALPESFLQRRIVCTNYKVLRHMYQQREHHKLIEWQMFLDELCAQLEHPSWVSE